MQNNYVVWKYLLLMKRKRLTSNSIIVYEHPWIIPCVVLM